MPKKETTVQKGRRYEKLAEEYLIAQNYVVLERNYSCRGGELDLIVCRGGVIVFVEVRMRKTGAFGEPVETVDERKQQKLVKAATTYLNANGGPNQDCRFDIIGIIDNENQEAKLEHFQNVLWLED